MTAKEKFMALARRQKLITQAKALIEANSPTLARPPAPKALRPRRTPTVHKAHQVTPPEGWLPVREFSRKYGVSETALFRAIKNGRVNAAKIGHCRYVDPESYASYHVIALKNRANNAYLAQASRREKAAARRAAKEA